MATQEKQFDVVDFLMAYDDGQLSDKQIIDGFQTLVDNGQVWKFEGRYGRQAAALIKAGLVKDTHRVLQR